MARLRNDEVNQKQTIAATRRGNGFARSEDGSLIIFGLMVFIMILTVGGMGVDFMRYETHRARLQATLDRAVLAAASLDQPLDPADVVMDYVARAGLSAIVEESDIHVVTSPIARKVDVEATMEVPSFFLNFVGIDKLIAPASAQAQQMASRTEISLVLDVSTSMSWDASGTSRTRIDVLKDAAETFVNMMMCDPSDPTKAIDCVVPKGSVALHIVPYSEQVTVGADILDYLNVSSEHGYSSCVHFPNNTDFDATGISEDTPLQRASHFDPWTGYLRYTSAYDEPNEWPCRLDESREIMAFEDDVPTLQARIAALEPHGNTSIDLGMKWAAALLDTDFQNVVANMREDGLVSDVYESYPLTPNPDNPDDIQKVIVLMTDGVNSPQHYLYDQFRSGDSPVYTSRNDADVTDTHANKHSVYRESRNEYYWPHVEYYQWYPQNRPYGSGQIPQCSNPSDENKPWLWNDSGRCTWVDPADLYATPLDYTEVWTDYTLRWWRNWGFLPNPGSDYDNNDKDSRLGDLCRAVKSEGMKVFTIGFDTNWTQEQILRSCASETSYYFDANGLNLEDIFAVIAREVSKLKLVN